SYGSKGLMPYGFDRGDGWLNDVATFLAAAAEEKQKRGHVLSFLTMGRSKQLDRIAIDRTRKFFQKTGRKITINRSDTAGYDKSKVECFNYHKLGHFARECRGPRNQDNRSRNQDSSRRTINVEEISSKAMLDIDGAGFDWSFIVDEEVPTNMALMAFSDSENNLKRDVIRTCSIPKDKFQSAALSQPYINISYVF
ncbi:ribonuclease H-like domain-containing protein, partial [Tanacetum coccineum]